MTITRIGNSLSEPGLGRFLVLWDCPRCGPVNEKLVGTKNGIRELIQGGYCPNDCKKKIATRKRSCRIAPSPG